MLSREELIRRASKIIVDIGEMSENCRMNVSDQHIANELAYARLLFDMSESNVYWQEWNRKFHEKVLWHYPADTMPIEEEK